MWSTRCLNRELQTIIPTNISKPEPELYKTWYNYSSYYISTPMLKWTLVTLMSPSHVLLPNQVNKDVWGRSGWSIGGYSNLLWYSFIVVFFWSDFLDTMSLEWVRTHKVGTWSVIAHSCVKSSWRSEQKVRPKSPWNESETLHHLTQESVN